jgi:FlaA1/EpsC-like NDP-sugar epimerase
MKATRSVRKLIQIDTYGLALLKQYGRRILLDLLIVPLAFYLGWLVRFDGRVPAEEWKLLTAYILPICLIYIFTSLAFGIYRRLWAYACFGDVILLSETIGLATLIVMVANFLPNRFYQHQLSAGGLVMGGFFTLILSAAAKYRRQLSAIFLASWDLSSHSDSERVLIVGVNETAQQLATRLYLGKHNGGYEVVGFVDDGPKGRGMSIHGVRILGTADEIPTIARDRDIDIIAIARRPSDRQSMWELVTTCRETRAQVKVLPDLVDFLQGRYSDPLALRDVSLEDILDRPTVTADAEACRAIVAGKAVLVTGAAGSIGSELCRQILCLEPQSLCALDNNETGLYELNLKLNPGGQEPLQLLIADVSDRQKINRVFERLRPQVVFHAAAYKHVPMLESHIDEALRVNVAGTVIVSEAAHEWQAERMILISTDKAVNPSSVMGASKRVGELWMKAMSQRSETVFTSVRFGNVIGSRGSVVPTFTRQIEKGGPVTVTHPDMRRFFMSIPEAVSLVLQAAALGELDEIFMLEMGEQVSILELAHRMIRLRGLRVGSDIEIAFAGIRPGEKLEEELAYGRERHRETSHPKIYQLECPGDVVDPESLLRAISVLVDHVCGNKGQERAREGLFQIAHGDIEAFLDQAGAPAPTRESAAIDRRWDEDTIEPEPSPIGTASGVLETCLSPVSSAG